MERFYSDGGRGRVGSLGTVDAVRVDTDVGVEGIEDRFWSEGSVWDVSGVWFDDAVWHSVGGESVCCDRDLAKQRVDVAVDQLRRFIDADQPVRHRCAVEHLTGKGRHVGVGAGR